MIKIVFFFRKRMYIKRQKSYYIVLKTFCTYSFLVKEIKVLKHYSDIFSNLLLTAKKY